MLVDWAARALGSSGSRVCFDKGIHLSCVGGCRLRVFRLLSERSGSLGPSFWVAFGVYSGC